MRFILKRALPLFLLILFSYSVAAIGFLDPNRGAASLTGLAVDDASRSDSCVADDVLFLRFGGLAKFDGKTIELIDVSSEGVAITIDGVSVSIESFGQSTAEGLQMILGDVFMQ